LSTSDEKNVMFYINFDRLVSFLPVKTVKIDRPTYLLLVNLTVTFITFWQVYTVVLPLCWWKIHFFHCKKNQPWIL